MPLKFWPQTFQPIRNLQLCRSANLGVPDLARGFVDVATHFAHIAPSYDDALFDRGRPRLRNDPRASGSVQKFRFNEQSELAEEISVQHFSRFAAIEIQYLT
ncbi:hypothetical protein [Candidatus Binatus sp.]|uniref:hypothetical protein n=1 Tax=Candidatus Binatus sp. TaxID=2811406 RepID=UPI002B4A1E0C|nr:hypothetical protein [Candidatus Binatus sp.]